MDQYLDDGLRVMFMGIKLLSEKEVNDFFAGLEKIEKNGTEE